MSACPPRCAFGDRAGRRSHRGSGTNFSISVLLVVGACAAEPGARAAPNPGVPGRLTLGEAVALFRRQGYDLLIARIAVDSARADERAAGAVANPSVSGSVSKSFSYEPTCHGCSDVGWGVTLSDQGALSDVLAGKRALRVKVARAALGAAGRSRDDTRRVLEFAVKQQYAGAALAQEAAELARQAARSTAQTSELVNVRYRAGEVSEADVARAETARLEAEQTVEAAFETLLTAKTELAYLLGMRAPAPTFEVDSSEMHRRAPPSIDALSRDDLVRLALEHRPDLRAAVFQKNRAAAAVSLNERQRVPDIALVADYMQEGTGQNAIQPPTLTFGVSLPLPVFYQLQGEIAKAEADLRTQSVELSKARAQVVLDVEIALAQFRSSRARVDRMESALLERAARAFELVKVQYGKGAASLLELLDAQRTFLTTRGEYLTDLDDYWTAVFALEKATGWELAK